MTRIPEKLFGIIGHPLGHTLSPALHNWGFAQFQLPAVYMAFPLPPERLADFLTAFRTLPMQGASVTIPHKEAVMPLLDEVAPRARTVGAVNTLYWKGERLIGENTDVAGFLAPLRAVRAPLRRVLVLGAGGAARAVLAGLTECADELGVEQVLLTNRSPERACALAAPFGTQVVPWEARTQTGANVLVNCTPLGMAGDNEAQTPWPAASFGPQGGLAYDLVYNPLRTRFLREAQAAGWQTLDGLHMFVAQGVAQFRLWTGCELAADAARERMLGVLTGL